jgi:biopolymer transport protein ExbD
MPIHEPKSRLMRFIPLEFVAKRAQGKGVRTSNASLNMTSMIDIMVVTVVFLLMTFSVSGDYRADSSLRVPPAENTLDMIDAPLISLARQQILLDGTPAGSTRAIEESGSIGRIDELDTLLKAKHELWKMLNPGRTFPGVCIMQVDQDISALAVKSVFATAARAGYPNVSFQVVQLSRPTRG